MTYSFLKAIFDRFTLETHDTMTIILKKRNPGSEKPKAVEFLKELFKKVKKAPSHYCRKQSSKIYLEPLLKNEKDIYRLYLRTVKDGGKETYSFREFMKYFKNN